MILVEQFLLGQTPKVFVSALWLTCLLPQLVGPGRNALVNPMVHL
ncbi:hypothetical protein NK6_1878 [Bradyrhizobium diazoefficiens]|uniref:Uncharacterized protein n=1 Tax=Bradyrhizobium diazoefficiens TaxID=1355477 RepID=A0A0E4FS44_9BRAD|nr:hypothetical protein NK6_1878 [Bradyrhizobium diazoefficiens]